MMSASEETGLTGAGGSGTDKRAEQTEETQSAEKRPRTEPHYIYLNLTDSYAPAWKSWDGVREFVQNYDGLLGNLVEISPPSYGRKRLNVTPVSGVCVCGWVGAYLLPLNIPIHVSLG